jgi:hypothetical protein
MKFKTGDTLKLTEYFIENVYSAGGTDKELRMFRIRIMGRIPNIEKYEIYIAKSAGGTHFQKEGNIGAVDITFCDTYYELDTSYDSEEEIL